MSNTGNICDRDTLESSDKLSQFEAPTAMTDREVFKIVRMHLEAARFKHPKWPKDRVHGAAIVAEEVGELIRAILNHVYDGSSLRACKIEAYHVIVTAIRFLTEL